MYKQLLVVSLLTTMTSFSPESKHEKKRCISPSCTAFAAYLEKHPDNRFLHRNNIWHTTATNGEMPKSECDQLREFFGIEIDLKKTKAQ